MNASQIIGVLLEGQSAEDAIQKLRATCTASPDPGVAFAKYKPMFVKAAVECAKAVLPKIKKQERFVFSSALKAAEEWLANPSEENREICVSHRNRSQGKAVTPAFTAASDAADAITDAVGAAASPFPENISCLDAADAITVLASERAQWSVKSAYLADPSINFAAIVGAAWAEMLQPPRI